MLDLINGFPDATRCESMEDGFGVHDEFKKGVNDELSEGVHDETKVDVHDEFYEGGAASSDDRDHDTRSGDAPRPKKAESSPVRGSRGCFWTSRGSKCARARHTHSRQAIDYALATWTQSVREAVTDSPVVIRESSRTRADAPWS